jgi:diacylglycerol kinase (ATP)
MEYYHPAAGRMNKPANTGWRRVYRAAVYSWQGIKAAWKHEAAFRQECAVALILVPGAFVLGQTGIQIAMLIAVVGIVLITELLNSAIEAVVDRIGEEHHELAGRAKDMGSAAVFVSLSLVVAVWTIIGAENFLLS